MPALQNFEEKHVYNIKHALLRVQVTIIIAYTCNSKQEPLNFTSDIGMQREHVLCTPRHYKTQIMIKNNTLLTL